VQPVCDEHGRLPRFPNLPSGKRRDCNECWKVYARRAEAVLKSRSVGRAKGGGQSSKQKGRAAVLEVAALIRDKLGLQDGDVWVKAGAQMGVDLHFSPFASAQFPFATEVKNQEQLNIWQALKQAEAAVTKDQPTAVLFFRRAGSRLYAVVDAQTFMGLVRRCRG